MKKTLDDYLCQSYPTLFVERNLTPDKTNMCWGFDCGDGWFHLIDAFCSEVNGLVLNLEIPAVVMTQVKSKLGSLRIHFKGGDSRVYAMTHLVRTISECVDEDSGFTLPVVASRGREGPNLLA
jgi:hypothetical protein